MSADFYYSIPERHRSPLHKSGTSASSVTGESIDTIGKTLATLHLGNKTLKHQFCVARNITHPFILGWDFLSAQGASISSLTSTFCMPDVCIPLVDRQQHQTPLKCNVSLIGKTSLPPMSEVHVHGRVIPPQADVIPQNYDGMFEPSIHEHLPIAGARSLSRPQDGIILIRLINPSSDVVEVQANTNLGQFFSATGADEEEYEIISNIVAGTQPKSSFQASSMLPTSGLSKAEYDKAEDLLNSYSDVFSTSAEDIGQTNLAYHDITTTTDKPVRQRAYRTSPNMRVEIQHQVDDLLQRGIIEESFSPWSSPIVMVKKKDDTYRFCVDYRALNAVTVRDSHPIPRQDDSIDALSSSSYFSVIDLSSGYWQVQLHPDSKEKTAFTTGTGLYHFNVMPFGLVNAPMTFQRLMERVLHGLHWSTCLVYLDDCIILGKNFNEHLVNLQEVLRRIREAGLKLKPSKCQLFMREVTYLGHVISPAGVLPDPNNTKKVSKWPRPTNATQVRSFLGLASFYRRFIAGFAHISSPLTDLTHKGRQFIWTDDCEHAFNMLKQALTSPPLLAYPDFGNKFSLATDASQDAVGAVLSQTHDGKDQVVAYYSQKLTTAQRKWSTYDRELWAIVSSIRHFRHYLRGQEFTILTDHHPLLSYGKAPIQDDSTGRRARWIVELSAYTFTITHRKGKSHQNADALSRLPNDTPQVVNMVNTRSATRKSTTHQPEQVVTEPQSNQTTVSDVPDNFILASHYSNLQLHQQQDSDIQRVIKYLKEGRHPTVREVRQHTPRLRRLLWQIPRFILENGILYRKRQDNTGSTSLQVVIPESLVPQVLQEIHGNPSSGHFGIQRTLHRAESMCFWPFMHKDVTNYCNTCTACESIRSPNPKHQAPLQSIKTDHPLQMVFADIAELPTSRKGNRYILVVVDHFSKYTNIYPMRDQTAHSVAKHLFEDYITEHGIPECLHTDQGRQFESRIVQDLCEKLGIRKSRSSPYHPQGAGIVERANRVIKDQLAKYIADQGGEWDQHIHQLQLAYNTSVHSSTGLTPYFILHGREARIPASITCPVLTQPHVSPQEYVSDICARLRKAFQHTQQKSQQAQNRQKSDYDTSTRMIKYVPGDLVWLHDPVNARNKLEPNWKGPFVVISVSSDNLDYTIADVHNENATKLVHHNRLKLFRSRAYLQGKGPPMSHPTSNLRRGEVSPGASHPSSDQRAETTPNSASHPPSSQGKPKHFPLPHHVPLPASIDVQWSVQPHPADQHQQPEAPQDQQPDDLQVPGQPPTQPGQNETDQQPWSDSSTHLNHQGSTQASTPDQLADPLIQFERPGPLREYPNVNSEVTNQRIPDRPPLPEQQPAGELAGQQPADCAPEDTTTLPQSRYGRQIRKPQRYTDFQM